jgi:hypothetical protein
LRNHCCFLFLWVLRWFTSPGSPSTPMYSGWNNPCLHGLGFPIRKSPDHSLLAAPRGLSQLATSFFAYSRQGIHTHALSSLTIKSTLFTEFSNSLYATCSCPSIYSVFKDRFSRLIKSQESDFGSLAPNFWLLPSEFVIWWAWVELNYRPHPYQGCALAT